MNIFLQSEFLFITILLLILLQAATANIACIYIRSRLRGNDFGDADRGLRFFPTPASFSPFMGEEKRMRAPAEGLGISFTGLLVVLVTTSQKKGAPK